MAQNFNRDKRRIEETKKKRREEKNKRKLARAAGANAEPGLIDPLAPQEPPVEEPTA